MFWRVLAVEDARLETGDAQVAHTLYELARLSTHLFREGKAEALLRRALAIEEVKLKAEGV